MNKSFSFNLIYIFFRDHSIPSLESVLANDEKISKEIDTLTQLMSRQTAVESNIAQVQASAVLEECVPPPVCHDFQTARLFLSHFGLLLLDEPEVNNKTIKLLSLTRF